ncbi:hypothetical protein KC930_03995 [Candidatus Saccharibacteria bacterium]|nr:hypothetical protein [Candidatus Saccharibacteria bacterium]
MTTFDTPVMVRPRRLSSPEIRNAIREFCPMAIGRCPGFVDSLGNGNFAFGCPDDICRLSRRGARVVMDAASNPAQAPEQNHGYQLQRQEE